jgi:hypothetical protein
VFYLAQKVQLMLFPAGCFQLAVSDVWQVHWIMKQYWERTLTSPCASDKLRYFSTVANVRLEDSLASWLPRFSVLQFESFKLAKAAKVVIIYQHFLWNSKYGVNQLTWLNPNVAGWEALKVGRLGWHHVDEATWTRTSRSTDTIYLKLRGKSKKRNQDVRMIGGMDLDGEVKWIQNWLDAPKFEASRTRLKLKRMTTRIWFFQDVTCEYR